MKKLIALLMLVMFSVGCVSVVVVDDEVVKGLQSKCTCTKTSHCKDAKCPVVVPTVKNVK